MEKGGGDAPFTILSERHKKWTIAITSLVTFVSPVSANIYYPALNEMASELGTTSSKINLTITAFMIVQGVGPFFVASMSDIYGRRATSIGALVIYLAVNIGLALQSSYPALMTLRCLQSFGSSTASITCTAVAADLVPRAERGKYMIYSTLGVTVGPAVGPIIGGILTQFLTWRSTFWFLVIFAGVMVALLLFFVPETCRLVVGNGSILPPKWNWPIVQCIRSKGEQSSQSVDPLEAGKPPDPPHRPSPLDTIRISMERETFAVIFSTTLLYCGYTAVLSTLPSQLQEKYGFNALQVGLCYIPYGMGSLSSRWTIGTLIDWNFRRFAKIHGVEIVQNRQSQLDSIPVEKARLQITIPLIYMSSIVIVGYGWVMNFHTNLAGPLIMLFFVSHLVAGASSVLTTLLVDLHVNRPATVNTARNLFRCLAGAGAVAGAVPLINVIGIGWFGTIIAFIWVLFSPVMWGVYFWGHDYRQRKNASQKDVY
ncbi:hypothetical protein N7532_006096 [Penicillium argentinense]|uniref:Major facilitator superfamily (MFS) profile domain-containing protein n=1 Tax=Penicillium argentinense TaxID=1131581 RepID=A0A9W9FF64_9EURO|nr:uncharacterized protein N7532_006096 [Penicillium argentinense]KAJ5099095.1 hypothetical protein N7532_006096 [Penicillium argentinense]